MSPGATFERVYHELKRMLAEGELPPGSPIEPAQIGKEIAASITPIRDALHRLTGERLVEAPNHNGFRVPLPTEAALRDLYDWNGQLLGLAVRHIRPSLVVDARSTRLAGTGMVAATASLFADMARATGSSEQIRAIQGLNDRLTPFRRFEGKVLDGVAEELEALAKLSALVDRVRLMRLIERYHQRRIKAATALLSELVVID